MGMVGTPHKMRRKGRNGLLLDDAVEHCGYGLDFGVKKRGVQIFFGESVEKVHKSRYFCAKITI